MSPTNPPDQSAQENLDREFEDFLQNESSRVTAAYRKLPRSEPAAALDLRVRALARAALRDDTVAGTAPLKPARRKRSWLPALSAAAIMVLAAGVVWRVAPQMWGARDSESSRAVIRMPVAVDAPSAQSAVNANGAMESAESAQLEKNRNAAKPGERAAAPEPPDKLAPASASPAGRAANASDDKVREAQPLQPPSDLRRERMQPAAPSPFPTEAAAKPVTATPAAPAPKSRPLTEPTTAPAPANPAPSAAPQSIVDNVVNAKPPADSASAVRSEPATVAAKTLPATPSAQSFAPSPQAGAAARLPSAPRADATPTSPVAAARSSAVTDLATPAQAPAAAPSMAPPPPSPAAAPPAPPPEKISSDEQTGNQQRLQEHVAESPTHWIERIRTLLQNRQRDAALWNLREFRKQYPAEELPADLRDLK